MFTDSANAVIFGKGNTLSAFIGSSIIVWPVHILIAHGVKEAAAVNLVATFVKVFPLVLFIGLAIYFFSPHTFTQDMAGASLNHSVGEQVKNTMLITLWVFTGLEGASVLSAHAKKKSDVGLATVLGIVIALGLYVAITVLSLGILPREAIAAMSNLSMAGLLESMMGGSGKVIITLCLIISCSPLTSAGPCIPPKCLIAARKTACSRKLWINSTATTRRLTPCDSPALWCSCAYF